MQQFDPDEFDEDAKETSEALVMNISDEPVRFEIATQAGSRPRRYKLNPGETVSLQAGYTQPFKGAGRGMVRATIESLTEHEIIPEITPSATHPGRRALRLPLVVHVDKADAARANYLAAMKAKNDGNEAMPTLLLHTEGGKPMRVKVQRKAVPVEDVEDQAGPLDDVPPDEADDFAIAPSAPPETPPTSSKRKGNG